MSVAPTQPIPDNLPYPAPLQYPVVEYDADGAIGLLGGGVGILSKATAGAYTLAVPTRDGVILRLVASTAAAHVVTQATVGFNAKGASGTITFGGAIGDSVALVSYNGNWYVLSDNNITPA